MIYLDTSVALAQLLSEDIVPPPALWDEPLVSSRLLEYELWTRLHARSLERSHGAHARALLDRVAMLELSPPVLARALEPFPTAVRTLDALHLSSAEFLRAKLPSLTLATYDDRMRVAAQRLSLTLFPL